MAFRFKRKESIAAGFARLVEEQIEAAVAALEKSGDDGVHEARKSIKRVRALLRLFRRAMPDGSYERENEALRTTARHFSSLRDAQVRLAVFDAVTRGMKVPGIAGVRRKLAADFQAAARRQTHAPPLQRDITTLRTIAARLPGLKPDSGWPVLSRGLKVTYRRARKAHAAAHAEHSTAAIHTWRRRSQDFAFQMQLLRKIDPPTMKRCIRHTARLTRLLGQDHDLAVLERHLAATPGLPADLRAQLAARIARRRRKLQRRAFAATGDLFFEKPAVVVKELGRSWKRWRK